MINLLQLLQYICLQSVRNWLTAELYSRNNLLNNVPASVHILIGVLAISCWWAIDFYLQGYLFMEYKAGGAISIWPWQGATVYTETVEEVGAQDSRTAEK